MFQGKNYIDVVPSKTFFSHFASLDNFICFEITFLKLFSSVCDQDDSLQNREMEIAYKMGWNFLGNLD